MSSVISTTSLPSTTTTPGSRVQLGPLLTTFTPPGICTEYGQATPAASYGFQGQGCSPGFLVDTSTCWPSATISEPSGAFFNGWGFYSPGTICPSGYTSACSAELANAGSSAASNVLSNFNFVFSLIPGETAVGCCPSGFSCSVGGTDGQSCTSTLTSGSFLAGYCPLANAANTETLTSFQYLTAPGLNTITVAENSFEGNTTTNTTVTAISSINAALLYAPLFQINWQASDRPTTSTASTISTSSAAPASKTLTSSPTGIGIPNGNATPTGNPSSGGLSTGAKIAIGVVVPVAVLALAFGLGFWLFRRRRRDRLAPAEPVPVASAYQQGGPGFAPSPAAKHTERNAVSMPPELESPRPELGGNRDYQFVPREMGS